MILKVVSTGSEGNCYLLSNSTETLVIECGISIINLKKALHFNLQKVAGVLVSHEHLDHSKSINECAKNGLNVFTHKACAEARNFKSHKLKIIESRHKYIIGSFKVVPFEVEHDVPCMGFIIQHEEMGNTVFMTDTVYSKYMFKDIHHWILEANYSKEIVDNKVNDGSTHVALRNRIVQSHMSIENCIELLLANETNLANNIVLVHLSDTNSNSSEFKAKIETIAPTVNVTVAENNTEVNFSKYPF